MFSLDWIGPVIKKDNTIEANGDDSDLKDTILWYSVKQHQLPSTNVVNTTTAMLDLKALELERNVIKSS